jgi:hypothetical protein
MKKLIYILLLLILQSACKKDPKVCNNYTQLITNRNNLADPKATGSQALLDTLAKHPEYQVTQVDVEKYGWMVNGNIFYKNLLIFNCRFMFCSDVNYNVTTLYPLNAGPFNFSLTPSITYLDAIKFARGQENFSKTCISYRLGIYDINAGQPNPHTSNYKLVWLVQGDSGYPYVYLDANTMQVYDKFDGIVF